MLAIGRELFRETGQKQLVLAGGVALNCVANGRLLREGPFNDIWIQPAAGDAGGALGAALVRLASAARQARGSAGTDRQKGSLLGPRFSSAGDLRVAGSTGATYRRMPDEADLLELVTDLLVAGKVVGWFQGRMEFGPRALGSRSILGDPRSPKMQATMNLKIKFRESFRPFAPACCRPKPIAGSASKPARRAPTCCWSRRCSKSIALR